MNSKEKELKELSVKIMQGLRVAMRKLVETKAASNADLIIGDRNGNIKSVPARDLLNII